MVFRKNPHLNSLHLLRCLPIVLVLSLVFAWYWSLRPALALPSPPPNPPLLTLTVPQEVLLGEDFKFKVTLTSGGTSGYGPFIDVILPTGGVDYSASNNPCDGITFVSAEMIGVNGGPIPLTASPVNAPCALPTSSGCVTLPHPYVANGINSILVPDAAQLVTIELPFGSYQQNQPPIDIQITAHMSNFADVNQPLNIYARAGFRFGSLDAQNNPGADPPVLSTGGVLDCTNWTVQKPVKPVLFTLQIEDPLSATPGPCFDGVDNGHDGLTDSNDPDCNNGKAYNGPEDETATGPNFPRKYKITLNIANTQTITNLKVQDFLPNNMQYQGQLAVTIGGSPATQGTSGCSGVDYVATEPPTNAPQNPSNNKLEVSFCNPVTGTLAVNDVTVTFAFFIPKNNANGTLVLPPNCNPATSINDVKAEGDWTPQDTRDLPNIHVTSDATLQDHTLADKCIAVQKSVALFNDTGAAGPTPGDTLKYTLDFQISDYKTVGQLTIRDVLSDGQQLLLAPSPTLNVRDKYAPGGLTGNFTLNTNLFRQLDPAATCSPVTGGTVITFRVSTRMSTLPGAPPRYVAGILTGGWASASTPTDPATGQIVFYVLIRDKFYFPRSTGDIFVDKDDPLTNCVDTFSGRVHTNVNPPTMPTITGVTAKDDSKTATAIVTDIMKKTVYAVRRGLPFICGPSGPACSNSPNSPQEVRPGDQVTFRIEKTIPSSDAEKLTIEDWLPLPVFDAPVSSTIVTACPPLPAPGQACRLMPTHTLSVTPTLTVNPATNGITFDYGTFNALNNQPRKIDLLFTATVTNKPFADGLFLTNEAQECENNTFGVRFCQTAIAQVKMREPHLQIKKGVVATNNPNGVFNPSLTPSGKWKAFGTSCPAFNPIINSANLGGLINSDLSNVDANDWVTFAIAIENTGGAPAYDIELSDIIPLDALDKPSCFESDYAGLCIHNGNGTSIPYTTAPGGHGRIIIKLATPLAPGSPANPTGTNIAIITFNAQLLPDIMPGCCDNLARLDNYASRPNGPDFVDAGFTPPFDDRARICVNPTLDKSIVATSEAHTTPQTSVTPQTPANTPQAAIGEIVRYRLAVRLPEGGALPNFQMTDALPPGVKFLAGSARLAFISTNGTGITHPSIPGTAFNVSGNQSTLSTLALTPAQTVPVSAISGGTACGAPVTFSLGTIQNNDNDTDLEYIVIEFNALVCNMPVNQNGATPSNTFNVSVGGNQIATSNPINVQVVEPNLVVQKSVGPINLVAVAPFTVTLTNTGTATAFDVTMTDTLPAGLVLLGTPTPTVSVSPAGCAVPNLTVSGSTLTVNVPQIPATPSCTVTLTFSVGVPHPCPPPPPNTAQVSYTSLPGPVGTQPNSTGSVTPGATGAVDGERPYTASGQAAIPVNCGTNCATPPPNMVSWWPLNETTGNNVVDIVGGHNGITSANIGSDPWSATSPKVVNALLFGNSKATVPGSSYNFGTGNFSIDAWVRGAQLTLTSLGIVDKLDTTSSVPTGFSLFVLNGRVQLIMGNGTASPATFMSSPTFNYNTWQHVAVTVKRVGTGSPVGQFYINGAPAGPPFTPPPNSVSNNVDLLIGSHRLNVNCQSCEVTLDEIEIFSDVVSATDINSIFAAGSAGKCAPACASPPPNMVGWWPLNETSGNTVVDIKGGNNGTTSANIGSDPVSATSPKVANALLFINSKATVSGSSYNFGTGNFSIDAWVRGPVSNAALGIVDKLDTSSAIPTGFSFFIRSGTVRLIMGNGTTSPATFMSTATFNYGVWQHVAVTVQRVGTGSPIGRFYLNGVPAGTFVPPPNSVNNTAALLIGSHRLNLGCSSCEVTLDEVEIFRDVVSPNGINSIFTAGSIGKCR